jgi:hypothetical protein
MSDRGFQVFMAFAVAVLVVIMSTPLTMSVVGDSASWLLYQTADAQAPASLAVAAK